MPQQLPPHHTRRFFAIAVTGLAAGSLLLAGCSAGNDTPTGSDGAATGFAFTFPQANDSENFYQTFAQKYMDETGTKIELLPVPGDTYYQQINTQLQAGNAADLLIAAPGGGQINSIGPLVKAGFLSPLDSTSAGVIPKGTESLYGSDGKVYGQPTSLTPIGMLYNAAKGKEIGIPDFPSTFDDYLAACSTTKNAGVAMTVIAGSVPVNLGLLAEAISATRVYASEPDWNQKRASGDVTFAGSAWSQVLADIKTMKDKGCFQAGAEGGTFDAISGGLIGGTALTASVPGSAATALSGASKGAVTLDVRAFPAASGEKSSIIASPLYSWVSNSKSDPAVQASVQKFLDWAAQPAQTEEFANLSGGIPVGAPDAHLLAQYAPVSSLISSGSFTPEPNLGWPNASVYDALGTGIQGLLTGQTDADTILKNMDTAWNQ